MEIDPKEESTPPELTPHFLQRIESKHTTKSPHLKEEYIQVVTKEPKNPFIDHSTTDSFKSGVLHDFAQTLPLSMRQPLFNSHGKESKSMKHPDASFTSEYRFRHIIPLLYTGNYLDITHKEKLEAYCPKAKLFSDLWDEYGDIDTSSIKGFASYKNSINKTTLNRERIRLHTAAFIQHNCDVEKLIYYLGGPHLGKQPQWQSIINKLKRGVEKGILQELECVYQYGAPRKVNTTNTEENQIQYYKY